MFFATAPPRAGEVALSVLVSLVLLASGLLLFSRAEKTFVDTV
jgi:ABC-type polysaccharide/polyol phosphate export permease